MKKTIASAILAALWFLTLSSTTALADGSIPQQCCDGCTCRPN